MDNTTSGLTVIGCIMCILIVIILFVTDYIERNTTSPEEARHIQLLQNIQELQNQTASKDGVEALKKQFEKEKSQLLVEVKKQQEKTNEVLDELAQVKSRIKATRQLNVASDKTTINSEKLEDKHKYYFKKITIEKDDKIIPIAWAMFYPHRPDDKKWKVGTYELEYCLNIAETENENGTFNRYAEATMNRNDVSIPIKVDKVQWEKIPLKSKRFYWFNPRLALSTGYSDSLTAGLNFSLMSYGKTKVDMDFRFLTFGVDYNSNNASIGFNFEPIGYNIGKVLPIIKNLYIGPYIGIDSDNYNVFEYGLQLSVPF